MIETLSPDACTDALLRELRWGREVKQTFQQVREQAAATEATAGKGHKSIPGLGKLAAVIPAHEFFLMREKFGAECWDDRGFLRDFQRLEPSMAVHKV